MFKLILQISCIVLSVNLQCIKPAYETAVYTYSPSRYNIADDCEWNGNELRYVLVNSKNGDVVLKFSRHLATESRLLVYVEENVTNRDCDYSDHQNWLLHSEVKYQINTSNVIQPYEICKNVSDALL